MRAVVLNERQRVAKRKLIEENRRRRRFDQLKKDVLCGANGLPPTPSAVSNLRVEASSSSSSFADDHQQQQLFAGFGPTTPPKHPVERDLTGRHTTTTSTGTGTSSELDSSSSPGSLPGTADRHPDVTHDMLYEASAPACASGLFEGLSSPASAAAAARSRLQLQEGLGLALGLSYLRNPTLPSAGALQLPMGFSSPGHQHQSGLLGANAAAAAFGESPAAIVTAAAQAHNLTISSATLALAHRAMLSSLASPSHAAMSPNALAPAAALLSNSLLTDTALFSNSSAPPGSSHCYSHHKTPSEAAVAAAVGSGGGRAAAKFPLLQHQSVSWPQSSSLASAATANMCQCPAAQFAACVSPGAAPAPVSVPAGLPFPQPALLQLASLAALQGVSFSSGLQNQNSNPNLNSLALPLPLAVAAHAHFDSAATEMQSSDSGQIRAPVFEPESAGPRVLPALRVIPPSPQHATSTATATATTRAKCGGHLNAPIIHTSPVTPPNIAKLEVSSSPKTAPTPSRSPQKRAPAFTMNNAAKECVRGGGGSSSGTCAGVSERGASCSANNTCPSTSQAAQAQAQTCAGCSGSGSGSSATTRNLNWWRERSDTGGEREADSKPKDTGEDSLSAVDLTLIEQLTRAFEDTTSRPVGSLTLVRLLY